MDPNLKKNPDLVNILAEWEEAWELAMPYVHSKSLEKSFYAFIDVVVSVCALCPEFKEACVSIAVLLTGKVGQEAPKLRMDCPAVSTAISVQKVEKT